MGGKLIAPAKESARLVVELNGCVQKNYLLPKPMIRKNTMIVNQEKSNKKITE
jgi:hypothetical protein